MKSIKNSDLEREKLVMEKKENTLEDWELLEAKKTERMREIEAELAKKKLERLEAMLVVEKVPEDLAIIQLQKETADIQEQLTLIAIKKDHARSFDLEETAARIRELDQKFPELAIEVDRAAEAYAQTIRSYLDFVKSFSGLGLDLRHYELGANEALSFQIYKYKLEGWLQHFARRRTMSEFVNGSEKAGKCNVRRDIDLRVERILDHAKHLRGEISGDLGYCPRCYSSLIYEKGEMVCRAGCKSE